MTTDERNAMIEKKKQEVFDMIFKGQTCEAPKMPKMSEGCKVIHDKNWNTGKSWLDQMRIVKNCTNFDEAGIREWQRQIRENNGVVYSTIDAPLAAAAPDPVK